GTWSALADGRRVYRMEIRSDGATGLRVQFSNFSVGAGKVWVHSAATVDGPYTARGPFGNGEFWSASVAGDAATIEYEAPGAIGRAVPFHVHQIAHEVFDGRTAAAAFDFSTTPDPAANCNLDVNCYPDWQQSKKSVAHIQFEEDQGLEQGTFLCSASLVATRDNSFIPYLLTAGHCIHDEGAARSLETFWNYESVACNAGPPATRGPSQAGGHLLAWAPIQEGDYSLVLLPSVPSGVVFSGWDPNDPDLGSPVTGIHHPTGSYKRISFGNTIASADLFVGTDFAPGDLYHTVAYTQGITQPGSSGSPLFSGPGVIIGMLTYGPALPGSVLCTSGDIGGYGKFSNAYNALEAYFEDLPFAEVTPSSLNVNFSGLNHAITGSATQTITLATQAASAVPFAIHANNSWVSVRPATGTVSASSPVQIQVTVNPAYFLQSEMYTSPLTLISGAAPPVYINVNVRMTINTSNVVATATPNPVPSTSNGTVWSLTLQLQETNGAATTLTAMKIDGVDYSSSIAAFFGSALIPANGTVSAGIHTTGLVTPVVKYFEFFGKDNLSGNTWYRELPVTFNP
ncbi:MAG TPA: trypsin-like peptidase domain-containing protein, partial [Bryobacteraceae bacterium]|nr:trypsin-like peptidase domain-containing protein [Bryobacteraceae bacterium]